MKYEHTNVMPMPPNKYSANMNLFDGSIFNAINRIQIKIFKIWKWFCRFSHWITNKNDDLFRSQFVPNDKKSRKSQNRIYRKRVIFYNLHTTRYTYIFWSFCVSVSLHSDFISATHSKCCIGIHIWYIFLCLQYKNKLQMKKMKYFHSSEKVEKCIQVV